MRHAIALAAMIGVFSLFLPGAAHGHKVSVFAWVDGDRVHVQGKFSGGKRVRNSDVTVTDPEGKALLRGKTDDEGEFSFKIPQKTALTVSLDAGAGHLGRWTIPAEETGAATGGNGPEVPATSNPVRKEAEAAGTFPVASPELGPEDIERIVEKVLDRKLKPVMTILADSQTRGPAATEIFGGVGYILGLMGVASYFHFRKTRRAKETDAD